MPAFRPLIARFWGKVERLGYSHCWNWSGCKNSDGYGLLAVSRGRGKSEKAHRVSWAINKGPIPKRMHVLHTCDNSSCVNPSHLWLGSHHENMVDMARKGRAGVRDQNGEKNFSAKLNWRKVRRIRASIENGVLQKTLAKRYDVSRATICNISKGKVWASL